MKIDCHNHAIYSPDASQSLAELAAAAAANGVGYLAVTEHMDLGFPNDKRPKDEPLFDYRVNRGYFDEIAELAEKYAGAMYIVAGIEAGYTEDSTAATESELAKYPFGYIINSVHICHGLDCYWAGYYDGYTQQRAYDEYLDCVRESLDAPYPFHAIGHLGYIARPAPYTDKRLLYADHADKLDDILRVMIARDKILELNSAVGSSAANGALCLPDVGIVKRYYELGGRLINFGSDSHRTAQFNHNYEAVAEAAKRIGFKEWTVVRGGKLEGVRID